MIVTDTMPRILLVEDDPLVATVLADMLEEAAFEVDGPYATLSDGVAAVAEHMPDAAVLDISLQDSDAFLIASDLEQYGIPYLFCSGSPPRGRIKSLADEQHFIFKDRASRELVPALQRLMH